jgi:histidine ammonia-lyase
VEAVAWGGERLALVPAALERVAAGQAELLALLAGGARVYGVNTGMGFFAAVDLDEAAQAGHQRNLLLGRAVGGPPWLPAGEARALLVARLGNLLSGHAGVGPDLCRFLTDRLNDGFTPAVPRRAVGCSGEVIPLAHAFQTLVGVGQVLGPDGEPHDAGAALAARGALPYQLRAKEGIALLAGAPMAAAMALARLRAGERLAGQLLAAAAAAVDALRAPLDPYDEAVGELAGDPVLDAVLARVRRALEGSGAPVDRPGPGAVAERRGHQAPVSFRVAPQVLAQLARTLGRLDEDVRQALAAVTDSPAVVGGRVVAGGGFHDLGLAAGMDTLASRPAGACTGCWSRFSGLPDQLTPVPGPRVGLAVVHKRAVGALNEARRLAAPASVGLADTSLGQEDATTFAPEAAEKLRRVEELAREVAACELLAARQAWWLRRAEPAAGLRALGAHLASVIVALERDELPLP